MHRTNRLNVSLAIACPLLTCAALLSGCNGSLLGPGHAPSPLRPCNTTVQIPASMFAVDAPVTASAGATFSVVPWVNIDAGSWGTPDLLLPSSFKATVDEASRTITVTGLVQRVNAIPNAPCAVPNLYAAPSGATLSLTATASAGIYTIVIPAAQFSNRVPIAPAPTGTASYPTPMATRSIELQ